MDAGEDVGEAAAAGRPAPLLEVLPQERVQQRTAEQIVDLCQWSHCFMCLCRRWWNSWWTFSHLFDFPVPEQVIRQPVEQPVDIPVRAG